jgi:hypothetical protein
MEILALAFVSYLLIRPNRGSCKRMGSKEVPTANYYVDFKVPKQPKSR